MDKQHAEYEWHLLCAEPWWHSYMGLISKKSMVCGSIFGRQEHIVHSGMQCSHVPSGCTGNLIILIDVVT